MQLICAAFRIRRPDVDATTWAWTQNLEASHGPSPISASLG